MLAYPAARWPTSGDWILQPKWDGVRCLIGVDSGDGVRAWDRDGGDLTVRLGDLLAPFAGLAPRSVFDGELIALSGGRSAAQDFAAVRRVVEGGDLGPDAHLCFIAFDVLCFDGNDVREQPWRTRDDMLATALPVSPRIRRVQSWRLALGFHEYLVNQGFAGSVLKRRISTYRDGRRTAWRAHIAERHTIATLLSVSRDGEGRARAVCDHEGQRLIASDAEALSARPGDDVAIVYSRIDADGSLRRPRVAD